MKHLLLSHYLIIVFMLVLFGFLGSCTQKHGPIKSRVPEHKIEEAKSWKAPFGETKGASPAIVAEGKDLFEGRGNCFMCHGMEGKGDGPASSKFRRHPPRDFTNCKFHAARTDGELFWVVKYGVPGTGMVRQIPWKLTDEQTWKIVAYVRTFCEFA